MNEQPQSIKDFCARIEEDAGKEIAGILERAEYTVKGRVSQILKDAEEKKNMILEKSSEEAKTAKRLVLSDLNLELKKVGLRIKGEMVEEALALLNRRLEQFRSSPEYTVFLENIALEGIKALHKNEVVIKFGELDGNRFTQNTLDDLRKRSKALLREDVHVSVSSDTIENRAGLRISTKDSRLFYDNTLQARIKRMNDDLRLIISRKIFG